MRFSSGWYYRVYTGDMIEIAGVMPSRDIRESLRSAPVLLAFSAGKDAIASWLALLDSGVTVVPYYMYYVPGNLDFITRTLDQFEDRFTTEIKRYPHPSIYRWLNRLVFQPPERCATIEAARLPEPTFEQMLDLIRADLGLPVDTWVADGVRATDSIVRRVSIKRHGPMKTTSHKVSAIWDWQKAEVLDAIESAGIELPVDYDWFGRSFDGLDKRFLEPLSRHAPDDYQRILGWYPLAEMELIR